ncbi:MAG: hypothetical protein K6A77_05465 [Clostridiales bacterium]|nr:hypothetical protein [Clostridiales bacterium]
MKASEIISILDAKVFNEIDEDLEIDSGCGCDLMSDVLAFNHNNNVLLTGAVNPQMIRTCEVVDTKLVVLVRDKQPSQEIIDLATDAEILLLGTHYSMFEACGHLYDAGLRGEEIQNDF